MSFLIPLRNRSADQRPIGLKKKIEYSAIIDASDIPFEISADIESEFERRTRKCLQDFIDWTKSTSQSRG